MSYEESSKTAVRPAHRLIMEQRERLSISGVENVESFDDTEVIIQTCQGRLIISGDSLHVGKLSIETGELTVDGLVTGLTYEESVSGGSLWTRLFK